MPTKPPRHRHPGYQTPQQLKAQTDRHRGSARARGYTAAWDRAAAAFKAKHPLCVMCQAEGRVTAAFAVDHIIPHRGDQTLFWDRSNWQSLCAPHHNSDKQRAENAMRDPR